MPLSKEIGTVSEADNHHSTFIVLWGFWQGKVWEQGFSTALLSIISTPRLVMSCVSAVL